MIMKKFMFIIAAAMLSLNADAANISENLQIMNTAAVTDDDVVEKPDVLPEFPGGMEAMMAFIGNNTKYPAEALKKQVQGKVIVQFVVTKEGYIRDMEVISKTPEILNKEALRVVKSMPRWKPGKKDGKLVNVKFVLPVAFKLQ